MSKLKTYSFSDPLYRAYITYVIGGTVPDLVRYLKRKHKNSKCFSWDNEFEWTEESETTDGYQFHVSAPLGEGEVFYVWCRQADPFLLFHETYHLVGDILHNRGVKYSEDSEESYAYLGGWIFEKIYTLLNGKLVL